MSWNDINPRYRAIAEEHLTDKQLQVLRYRIGDRLTWDQIAYAMHITDATARGHFEAALRRLKPHIRKEPA